MCISSGMVFLLSAWLFMRKSTWSFLLFCVLGFWGCSFSSWMKWLLVRSMSDRLFVLCWWLGSGFVRTELFFGNLEYFVQVLFSATLLLDFRLATDMNVFELHFWTLKKLRKILFYSMLNVIKKCYSIIEFILQYFLWSIKSRKSNFKVKLEGCFLSSRNCNLSNGNLSILIRLNTDLRIGPELLSCLWFF